MHMSMHMSIHVSMHMSMHMLMHMCARRFGRMSLPQECFDCLLKELDDHAIKAFAAHLLQPCTRTYQSSSTTRI